MNKVSCVIVCFVFIGVSVISVILLCQDDFNFTTEKFSSYNLIFSTKEHKEIRCVTYSESSQKASLKNNTIIIKIVSETSKEFANGSKYLCNFLEN
ncbi:putative ORFan [Cotonvirus japonicus]|uniref:ORFan n=1 Tax=Cotonvirus japonicus TaxID=2811091 RepID=A0ABM7NTY2_9VIRU|nr:putative ORFan [Cotonvirus japonicus]BCS83634.1 putative ORFan [Cotonvirus japonicus]